MKNLRKVNSMLKSRVLKNGNVKLENSRRTKYCIFSKEKNRVVFNAGINLEAVKQFEAEQRK